MPVEDADILSLLQKQQERGAEALLEKYSGLIRYVIRGILPNPQDAEDCFSEVSLLLWQKISGYDPQKAALSSWITAVARNTALNHWRAGHRREAHQTDSEEEPTEHVTPESEVLRRERAEQIKTAVNRLKDRDRQLFYRKYYYLQSTAQIAAETGMSERAAEGRLYRLRQTLRRELGGDGV